MKMKNIALFSLIVTAHLSIHAMEVPYSDKETAFLSMAQTVQFQAYQEAQRLHEKYNTPETLNLMQEALELLLKTKESQSLLQITGQSNSAETFSDNVIIKHSLMEQTPEHKQYEEAKLTHSQHNTADTLYMVNLCRTELRNTKECQDWLNATHQESDVLDAITHSKKWITEQKHTNFQSITTDQRNKNNAWITVTKTPEYQLFKRAKLVHEQHKTADTQVLLDTYRAYAKETPAYKQYFSLIKPTGTTNKQMYQTISTDIIPTQSTSDTICSCFKVKKLKPNQQPITILLKDNPSTQNNAALS